MSTVPAADQLLSLLSFLGRQSGPVPAAVIARELRLPRSSVYHLLAAMRERGYVVHLPEERRYGLGLAAYELGTGYSRQAPLQRLARIPLADLVDRTGHNGHLAVLHGNEVVYVIEERAKGRPPLVTDVGVRLPAQLTASGRAMLAALPAAQVRALFPSPDSFVQRNDAGPRTISAMRALLTEARRDGYASEDGEVTSGFASVAAAVRDHSGHPVAAAALTFPADEVPAAARTQLAERVARTAELISRRLSGTS